MDKTHPYERYSRQVSLQGFGKDGQAKLARAKILVAGAGGLGCPVLQYMAAAGVGTIGIIDGDIVDISNLHRQVLYTMEDIGQQKAIVAANKIKLVNPQIDCKCYSYPLHNKNAFELISEYDMVLDCTDNFAARYMISDACTLLDKPLIYAAVFQYEGQLSVFNTAYARITYRDLFPEPPDAASVQDCNEAGVLGVLPGMIGILQATEAIKLITGIGEPLAGKLLNYDIRTHHNILIELTCQEQKTGPQTRDDFEAMNYEWFCGSAHSITKNELAILLNNSGSIAIDVREPDELPVAGFPHIKIPLSTFDIVPDVSGFTNIIVFCQSGIRSNKAAGILAKQYGPQKRIVQLRGGLTAYNLDRDE